MTRASGLTLCALLTTLACGPVDQPLSSAPSQAVEVEASSRFGFELRLPNEFLDDGWGAYSVVQADGAWDRYRSLKLFRRYALVVAAPPRTEAGVAGSLPRIETSSHPVMELRVYEDVPELTFGAIADTIRHLSFGISDWDLNGTHVKEIHVDDSVAPTGYAHTSTDVPRIIAKENGFIYAFYYEGYLVEAERILSGFRTNPL